MLGRLLRLLPWLGTGPGHRTLHACRLLDLAPASTMLDDNAHRNYKTDDEGPETFMKHITCIEDLRLLHKRRVPKAFFDYADRGSYSEDTLRANSADLQDIKLRQRILVD